VTVRYTVDTSSADRELERLAHGPAASVHHFESALLAAFAETQGHVHVITGALKSSGKPSSSFDGSRWTGTLSYARHPGIFELARGDHPTANHPEGGHYFFDPGGPQFLDNVRQLMTEFLRGD
jgi:hypothetical protein